MDLLESLRAKLKTLPQGQYSAGLQAVVSHVDIAFRHLQRAQQSGDDSLFTDAVYRTNQAFEGSVKEAYRVLADSDPSKMRPFDIENYLEKNNVFKARVLGQFRTYRTEWRNQSVHDYTLVFDEGEALLAITSVSAFAYLLFDEIAERLAERASQAEAQAEKPRLVELVEAAGQKNSLKQIETAILLFAAKALPRLVTTEAQIVGAMVGFIKALLPELWIASDVHLGPEGRMRPDILIGDNDGKVIIEVKRSKPTESSIREGIAQLEGYMTLSMIPNGILFFAPRELGKLELKEVLIPQLNGIVRVMTPI